MRTVATRCKIYSPPLLCSSDTSYKMGAEGYLAVCFSLPAFRVFLFPSQLLGSHLPCPRARASVCNLCRRWDSFWGGRQVGGRTFDSLCSLSVLVLRPAVSRRDSLDIATLAACKLRRAISYLPTLLTRSFLLKRADSEP